jgi:hypothetical protein
LFTPNFWGQWGLFWKIPLKEQVKICPIKKLVVASGGFKYENGLGQPFKDFNVYEC